MTTAADPVFHTTQQQGDLVRRALVAEGNDRIILLYAVCTAVLQTEAFVEQQTDRAIAEARRRWPDQWADRIHDHVTDESDEAEHTVSACCDPTTCAHPSHAPQARDHHTGLDVAHGVIL